MKGNNLEGGRGADDRPDSRFDTAKKEYFSRFAIQHREHFKLHKEYGVLAKEEGWRNVSEHCLLEGVVADILAEGLKLDEADRSHLVTAALLHDFFKKEQMRALRKSGGSQSSLEAADRESSRILVERGYPKEVIDIASAAADVRRMTDPDVSLSERIMQYIDDITINNRIGSIDARVDKNEANQDYQAINESGREILGGLTYSEAQRKFGKEIQEELAQKLDIEDPETLPQWIEQKLISRIEQ